MGGYHASIGKRASHAGLRIGDVAQTETKRQFWLVLTAAFV
jgi:hypothetical protein